MRNVNKSKVTGVVKDDEKLEEKVKADLSKKDPLDAKEIVEANTISREKQRQD